MVIFHSYVKLPEGNDNPHDVSRMVIVVQLRLVLRWGA
jgi:hypothetical protein